MDNSSSSRFFAKLRKVAVNLEKESSELLRAYERRNDEDDDEREERNQRAMRAWYEKGSEVKALKSQVQADLKQERDRVSEVERFLAACAVMKQRVGRDVEVLRTHVEKYGYQAPQNQQKTQSIAEQQQQEEDAAAAASADAEEAGGEGGSDPAPTPAHLQRTPQFSDFGLSEYNLRKRMMEEAADRSGEAEFRGTAAAVARVGGGATTTTGSSLYLRSPQPSDFGLSDLDFRRHGAAVAGSGEADFHETAAVARVEGGVTTTGSSLYLRSPQPADFGLSEEDFRRRLQGPDVAAPSPYFPPSMFAASGATPKTPKCMLRLDDEDDELRTPQAPYFGVYSEHTMCLNNDFTMDLQRKDTQLHAASSSVPALHPGTDGSASYDGTFLSPNPSVPREGAYGRTTPSPPPPQEEETPLLKAQAFTLKSPEAPQFYLDRMHSLGKTDTGSTSGPAVSGQPDWDLPTPANRSNPDQRRWEYNVPELVLDDDGDNAVVRTPETPVFVSWQKQQLTASRGAASGNMEPGEPSVPSLKLVDGPMKSPVTPDFCSETLANMQQLRLERKAAVGSPNHRPQGKENRGTAKKVISEVTQAEFQRLPSYIRQMPVSSLNQAIQRLNQAAADPQHDENKEFTMSDLKKLSGLDTPVSKAPVYFLCLTELNRLKQVRGVGMSSEYKLITK